jgi:hypothetical protein
MTDSNFETATDLNEYWITQDCLCPVNYDIYFSLGTRYYCDAGCHVCYIEKNFKHTRSNLPSYFPEITTTAEHYWQDAFSNFLVVATADDMMFLKLNYPKQFAWYQAHAYNMECSFTDNAIFRTARIVKDIQFKNIASISISSDFASKVNPDKLHNALLKLHDVSPIKKIKFVDCGNIEALKPFIEFANVHNMANMVHHNFITDRKVLEHNWASEQNTWVDSTEEGLVQIHREAPHLFFDRYYFSSDDASDLSEDPWYIVDDLSKAFDKELFLTKLIEGKQKRYLNWINQTNNPKFKDYFKLTDTYKVNSNYNFIPGIMLAPYTRYCNSLIESGWVKNKFGLVKPTQESIIPIIERKHGLQ